LGAIKIELAALLHYESAIRVLLNQSNRKMKTDEAQGLLTRFFYRDNHLCFQILIQTESELISYGQYNDYSVYKSAFEQIRLTLSKETKVIKLLEKNKTLETPFAKVA
jgi:hypothetical protein